MATIPEKILLMKGLLSAETAFVGPFYATVDVTRRCNLRCVGCRYFSPNVNMPSPGDQSIIDVSVTQFKQMCDQLNSMGTKELIICGEGEPFLHPDFPELLSIAKGKGFHLTVLTNGTLLHDNRIQAILKSKLDVLKVSLWATSKAEYGKIHIGTKTSLFEQVVNGVKSLADSKRDQMSRTPLVQLYMPINGYNFRSIDKMVVLADTMGCDAVLFSPFRTRRGELASFSLSPKEEKQVITQLNRTKQRLKARSMDNNIDEVLLRYKVGESVWLKLPCYIPWVQTRIKVDGTVLACNSCELVMGNLNEDHFKQIWNNSTYKELRSQMITCEGLKNLGAKCDCNYCCFVRDNDRVHRLFRWISPLSALSRRNGRLSPTRVSEHE